MRDSVTSLLCDADAVSETAFVLEDDTDADTECDGIGVRVLVLLCVGERDLERVALGDQDFDRLGVMLPPSAA